MISTTCLEYIPSSGPFSKGKPTKDTKLDIRLLAGEQLFGGYSYSHIYAEAPLYSEEKGEEILRNMSGMPLIKLEGKVKDSKILMKKLWVNDKEYDF